ncbi:two-component sensor histidine kinase [Actinoplanes ianthinogenes]|uniref:histidine kinase n=1 Tax=Actinoplanes ianthinogenes TaxID=122358 RepID=A0ABN6CQI6_9ACTN|nr:HAMP domain-containing sensor histidine kinase [Actinoplanes ianthinogenes]BCJ47498.1 two-component sensor histidine kinase [Actinoplanes ianthinogenes]GGR02183.1 two-component sensor histidine kinase [Actinoplanes ianthinogenes]
MTRRLLLSYLSLVLLVLLALEIPLGILYTRGTAERFLAAMERDAVVLAERSEEAIEEGERDRVPGLLSEYTRGMGGRVVVVDDDGLLVADSAPGRSSPADPPALTAALREQRSAGFHAATGEWVVTLPAASGTTIRGAVQVSFPASAGTEQARHVWWVLSGAGLAVLLIAAAVAAGLARWMTRPLRDLEQATAQLADGAVPNAKRLDQGPPEVRRLAATFAVTADRLQRLIAGQRAFAADASHQLKTPLTALRLRLENLEPAVDPAALGSLEEAVAETDRLARMVQGLLALARLDDAAVAPVAVDADAVIADRAAGWAAFAHEQHVTLVVAGPPAGKVLAVPGALEQILDNLLANALRVAPIGSRLTIATRVTSPGATTIHVIDEGPGMAAEDRKRAFDRFWRSPQAGDDGSGLGLAIVERLVRAGGGQIRLDRAPGGGIDAVIRLRPADRLRVTATSRRPRTQVLQHLN